MPRHPSRSPSRSNRSPKSRNPRNRSRKNRIGGPPREPPARPLADGRTPSSQTHTQSAISATIDANGNVSDVLPIPSEELDQTKSYEVISWPSRSFPTDANLYARADITIDWDALFPEEPQPEEPVLTLTGPDGEELTSITQGDEVTFTLGPVDAGTEFEVTIQSDPITLPAPAIADADGIASATWTVAEDFEPGEHTVTFASDSRFLQRRSSRCSQPTARRRSPDGAGTQRRRWRRHDSR